MFPVYMVYICMRVVKLSNPILIAIPVSNYFALSESNPGKMNSLHKISEICLLKAPFYGVLVLILFSCSCSFSLNSPAEFAVENQFRWRSKVIMKKHEGKVCFCVISDSDVWKLIIDIVLPNWLPSSNCWIINWK